MPEQRYPLRLRERGRGWRPIRQAHRERQLSGVELLVAAIVALGILWGAFVYTGTLWPAP